jgi:hypothetical protein
VREVPRWKRENDCYSCHNNGDAARALIVAASSGHEVRDALQDTLDWLRRPEAWDHNKTEGGIDDKPLARVQFAGALTLAVQHGRASIESLRDAATIVAGDQKADGSWQLDTSQSMGSPTTYGTALATATARRVIVASRHRDMGPVLARADAWLRAAGVESAEAQPIYTAPQVSDAIARGREYLIAQQTPDGGWPETTRPANQESYAQRISTTGWALLALMATDPR